MAERDDDHHHQANAAKLPQATPYRVSTITAVGNVGVQVDLARFFAAVPVVADDGDDDCEGCEEGRYAYAELATKWRGLQTAASKAAATRRAARQAEGTGRPRHFDNQVTIVQRMHPGVRLNIKVFKNGQVQLTGIKRAEQGEAAVKHLAAVLRSMDPSIVLCGGEPRASGYRVCLINSDFSLGFELKRDHLLHWLRASYLTKCSFEPCIYPGVKINYMWNSEPSTLAHHGVCQCSSGPCDGKGAGLGDGKCRKVTIAMFQSGSVIITGAHCLQQLDDAYRFAVFDVGAVGYNDILLPKLPPKLLPAPVV
jgi:TATA-box binding protein (TBP) (component of TFIID and TFIIIB)